MSVAQKYTTPLERLHAAQSHVAQCIAAVTQSGSSTRVFRHDAKRDTAMFFQADLSPEELDWISVELGKGLTTARAKDNMQRFLDRHAALVIAALVNAGAHLTEELSFWPVLWDQLGYPESQKVAQLIRSNLTRWLREYRLEAFAEQNLRSSKYVTISTLHAGIPTKELGELVDDSIQLLSVDDDPEDGDREGTILAERYARKGHPQVIGKLAQFKKPLAAYIFARVVEYVHYARTVKSWYTDPFEGTNGLPLKVFAELRRFLHQRQMAELNPGTNATTKRPAPTLTDDAPFLRLDIDAGRIDIVVPEVAFNDDSLAWFIDAGFDTFSVTPRVDFAHRRFASAKIAIEQPTARVSVSDSLRDSSFDLPLHDEDFPVAFFNRNFDYAANQAIVTASSFYAVAPSNTIFSGGADNSTLTPAEKTSLDSWSGWSVFFLHDLGDLDELVLSLPDTGVSTTRQIRTGKSRLPEWFDETGRMEDLHGVDYQPVFAVSPELKLPQDEATEWTMTLVYLAPDGTRELVLDNADASAYEGRVLPIFQDHFEDAWVGRYEVTILGNGLVQDKRTFNMAEGCLIDVDYHGTNFRYPDANVKTNGYSPVHFHFEQVGPKTTRASFQGNAGLSRSEETREFSIFNSSDYELRALVAPKSLQYLLPQDEGTTAWATFPSTVARTTLAADGQLKLRFPSRVPSPVELAVIQGKSTVKYFRLTPKRRGRVFTLPLREVFAAFPESDASRDHDLTLTLRWYDFPKAYTAYAKRYTRPYSYEDFEKDYDAWKLPFSSSTIARISSHSFMGTVERTETTLELKGKVFGKARLRGFLWPITSLDRQPIAVDFTNSTAQLPPELQHAGPLALELVEDNRGYSSRPPATPSARAYVIEGPGYFIDSDSNNFIDALALQLSTLSTEPHPVRPEQRQALWRELHLGRKLSPFTQLKNSKRKNPSIYKRAKLTRVSMDEDPRGMLGSLGRSNIRVGLQPSLALKFDLFSYAFTARGTTQGEFHPVPWVGVLEELNDIASLAAAARTRAQQQELEDSLAYVAAAGAPDLPLLLAGVDTTHHSFVTKVQDDLSFGLMLDDYSSVLPGLFDVAGERDLAGTLAVRHGWYELIKHRDRVDAIGDFTALRNCAEAEMLTIPGAQTQAYISSLRDFAVHTAGAEHTKKNRWPWVAFISAVLAHRQRGAVHQTLASGPTTPTLSSSLAAAWSELAEIAPTLVVHDLIRAEARHLGLAHRDLDLPTTNETTAETTT